MAWYDDKKKVSHVATYKDATTAEAEGREAAAKGWTVRETTVAAGGSRSAGRSPGDCSRPGRRCGRAGRAKGAR